MKSFLTVVGFIGVAVGLIAVLAPSGLVASKGADASAATLVWVREVGVAIFALGVMSLLVRAQPPSPTLRALLVGNAIVQFGLLPIELLAWSEGTLRTLAGVAPNSVLHLVLGVTFTVLAGRMETGGATPELGRQLRQTHR